MAGNDSHIQQGEVDSLVEAIEELKAKIAAKDARIAELEEALKACNRYFHIKKSWDNRLPELVAAKDATRAALAGAKGDQAAPEESHVER